MVAKRRTPSVRKVTADELRSAAALGRPRTKLSGTGDLSERETLVILRRKVAAQIDEGAPVHALANLVRQFRQLDKDIRALDAAAAEFHDGEDDDDGGDSAAFDAAAV